ncbi:competence protein ComG [Clostridioides difficile]|nr:competence protein ComG [Clostridioides difficile]AVB35698.1 competence protein ComG [Clostridioides difficile]AVB39416.1 competence protein ComG [Clostridioides difficile]AVB43046.1 competence protein ComG [Clostridioides difficile]AVB51700.1 competence protein ComG [Clostridioides difficile]
MSPYIINSFQQNSCIKQCNFDNLNLSNKKESVYNDFIKVALRHFLSYN